MRIAGCKKWLILCLAFALFMGMAGTVLAWQFSQSYTSSTLWGQPQGKPWSPYQGTLAADVGNVSGKRQTNPYGHNVAWNNNALNYIRTNGRNVAITFHSYRKSDNGCSTFELTGNAATNLPAPQYLMYRFRPLTCLRYTEGRIYSTNANLINAYSNYWGQVVYQDDNTTTVTQKISVDTYYGGAENWHQTYCIRPGEFLARVCSSSDP